MVEQGDGVLAGVTAGADHFIEEFAAFFAGAGSLVALPHDSYVLAFASHAQPSRFFHTSSLHARVGITYESSDHASVRFYLMQCELLTGCDIVATIS